nr:hypothetical protein [uncultured Acetatifactor sp.]
MQKVSKRFEVAKKMPPLRLKVGNEYSPEESEVINWLIKQADILNYIFDAVRGNGRRESPIIYNPDTGTWQGVDYDGN